MKALFRRLKRVRIGTAIALVVLLDLVLIRVWDPPPIEMLRLRTFDLFQAIKPREATQRPVVLVDIDEPSLAALGQWPWPRTILADLVTKLTELGALAIAFDAVFPEPDRSSPAIAAARFRGLDDETRGKLRALPSNDEILAGAMRESRVVVGQSGLGTANADAPAGGVVLTGFATLGADPSPYLWTLPGLLRNVPVLEEAAAGRGVLTIRPERDGIVRRVPVVMKAGGIVVPAITLELLRVVSGSDSILIRTDEAGIRGVRVATFDLPTDPEGRLWVHFGPHDPARYVSAVDVMEGRVPAERMAGRLVLIGTSAVGLLDLKTTPVDSSMPGVEVQAQLLENALTGAVLSAPSYAGAAELGLATLVGLAMIVLAPVIGAATLFAVGGAIAASLVGFSWYLYTQHNTLIDFTFPLISSFLVYLTLVFTNYFRAHRERSRIRLAFNQYLSPALVEQLAQTPEKLVLGGESRTMTVMFSDVRGFTAISELYKDDPQGLTSLMNRLLTPLTNAIIERQGTIDKYMGDAIMAFWNAPLDDAAHPLNACDAALTMQERLADLNREREQEAQAGGVPFIPLNMGVGLNTGPCVVGNMGSDLHFNYSVLGDTVNLSSRLEGQSKTYGVATVIGSRTAAAVEGRFAALELDLLQVKGKTEPETVYTILGRADVLESPRYRHLLEVNGAMLSAYRGRDWQGALEAILLCREAGKGFGLDPHYDLYLSRVRALLTSPPPPDWAGVFAAESK